MVVAILCVLFTAVYLLLQWRIAFLSGEFAYAKALQKETADRLQDCNDNLTRMTGCYDAVSANNKKLADELHHAKRKIERIEDAVKGVGGPVMTTTSAR